MVQIDLTTKQIEELKNHYILELEKLQQRTTEIMGLLGKLVHGPIAPLPGKEVDLATPVDKTKTDKKRRGRPSSTPNLGEFIIRFLQENKKPVTKEQIITGYKKQNKIDLSGSTSGMSSLNQALFRLRTKQNVIISTKRKGKRGNVYSLAGQAASSIVKPKPGKEKKTATTEIKLPANTKYNWPQFIIDTLTKAKRILPLKEIVGHAMVHYTIPSSDKKSTYGKISPVLTQMVKAKDKIRTCKKAGTSHKYYALNDWFTGKNELITLYK